MSDQTNWTHPQHSKGVKSPTLASAHVRSVLTDRQITLYILLGRYGEDARRKLQSIIDDKKSKKSSKKKLRHNLLLDLGL